MEQCRLDLLQRAVSHIDATMERFASLLRPGVDAYPIPYFGEPLSARFATIGVNPSATEFVSRRWPKGLAANELDRRLTNYFNAEVPHHPWFNGYGQALDLLGHAYSRDTVHLDLSPRATKSMRSAEQTDRKLFLQMMQTDVSCFFALLPLCRHLRAAIMAGTVTKCYYIDEFLFRALPTGWTLRQTERCDARRPGATALYHLQGPGLDLPILFCRRSPSGDSGRLIAAEVSRLLGKLNAAGFGASEAVGAVG